MRKNRFVVVMLCAVLLSSPLAATGAPGNVEFGATKARFLDTEDAEIRLVNNTGRRIELVRGTIRKAKSGDMMARLDPETRFLGPGDAHEWVWLHEGNAGLYRAVFRTSVGKFVGTFEVGAYFTLAFRCDDTDDCEPVDPFVIFVRTDKPIRQLRTDLGREEDQRRIVSGVVRGGKRYNPSWSFTMGPGSIVLGEVFIEVCDAHPNFVENHRRRWMGERWCPWSSFVASEGR